MQGQNDTELSKFARDLDSKLEILKAELIAKQENETSRLKQEHEETTAKLQRDFDRKREEVKDEHKQRLSR